MKRTALIWIFLSTISCMPTTDDEKVDYILSKHYYKMEIKYTIDLILPEEKPDILQVSFQGNKRVATFSKSMLQDNEAIEPVRNSNKIDWSIQKDSLLREYYKMSLLPKDSFVNSNPWGKIIYRLKAFPYEVTFYGDYDLVSEGIAELLEYPYGK